MQHSKMQHSKMQHSKMQHSKMQHSKMQHSKMQHSKMQHSLRKVRPRGYHAAAYKAGHQTTVTMRVTPEAFQQMTPGEALAEANKIAINAGINDMERTVTIEHLQDAECPPKWRVSFGLLVRRNVHEGTLRVEIVASETSLNELAR